jgi:hypothetical protein
MMELLGKLASFLFSWPTAFCAFTAIAVVFMVALIVMAMIG